MPDTLVLTLALAGVFCIGWLVVAALMREERAAALCLGLYGVLDAVSLALHHHNAGSGLPHPDDLSLALLAAFVADVGSDLFVNRRTRHLPLWLVLLAGGVALQWAPAFISDAAAWHAFAYDLFLFLLLAAPLLLFARPLHAEFGALGLLTLAPFAAFAVVVGAAAVEQLTRPGDVAERLHQHAMGGLPVLLPFVLVTGAFHLCWLGVMVGRQVATARRLARYDDLTGMLQRSAFEIELEGALARARRHLRPLSLAFIDVDHFKAVNDLGGHQAGDQVLRRLSDILRHGTRTSDHLCRWGGEEFVLLMSDTDRIGAQTLLDRLQAVVRSARLELPTGCPELSVSIGFASTVDGHVGAHGLIDTADRAMYQAKLRGRDTIVDASSLN